MIKSRSLYRGLFSSYEKSFVGSKFKPVVVAKNVEERVDGKPKWMRFFEGTSELEIDLDRSLSNIPSGEVDQFVSNFILTNISDFKLYQIIRSLKVIPSHKPKSKLLAEIRMRIVQGDWMIEEMDLDIIAKAIPDYINSEEILREFYLFKSAELYSKLSLHMQLMVIGFHWKNNKLSENCVMILYDRISQEEGDGYVKLIDELKKEPLDNLLSYAFAFNGLSMSIKDEGMKQSFESILHSIVDHVVLFDRIVRGENER